MNSDTPMAVMIGLVYGELPFMILPLYAVLQKLDPALLEAADGTAFLLLHGES